MAPRFVQISAGALICGFVLLPPWEIWRQPDWPTSLGLQISQLYALPFCRLRFRRSLGFAAGLTAALSISDLGVIALFGDTKRATLPLELYQLILSDSIAQAAGCASLLLILSFGFFWRFDTLGRRNA